MNFKKKPVLLGCAVALVVLIIIFSSSNKIKDYDTEFASFTVESYLDYTYKAINSEKLQKAQKDGILPYYLNRDNGDEHFISAVFLANGLLPKNERIDIDVVTFENYMDDLNNLFNEFKFSDEVLKLGIKLMDLYSKDISYTIKNSEEVSTETINSSEFDINSSKDVPITYGKVTLQINPIDVLQGMDKKDFDLLWKEMLLQYDDKEELKNTYLVYILNMLINNYTQTVYKDAITHNIDISYISTQDYTSYTMNYKADEMVYNFADILEHHLFDYFDMY